MTHCITDRTCSQNKCKSSNELTIQQVSRNTCTQYMKETAKLTWCNDTYFKTALQFPGLLGAGKPRMLLIVTNLKIAYQPFPGCDRLASLGCPADCNDFPENDRLETSFASNSDWVSVSSRVSRPVFWRLGLELFVSRLCIGYFLWTFARKSSFKKRFQKMIVQTLAL